MRAGLKATAAGAVVLYGDLTPNLQRLVAKLFESELTVTYAVGNGELAKPSAAESNSIDNFYAFLEELAAVVRRQFQRGCNSKQLIEMALSALTRS